MADLETRVAALEKGAAFNSTQEAIRIREAEFLTTLREMKASMAKEQQESKGASSSEEVGALKEENAKLKALLTKHEYRINHLVAGMEKMLAAKK